MGGREAMMTLRTGSKRSDRGAARPSNAFTLIELILVMAMLLIVLGVAFPSLKRFFRGRNLDSEARRFLSLTHPGDQLLVAHAGAIIPRRPLSRYFGCRAVQGQRSEQAQPRVQPGSQHFWGQRS